MRHLSLLLVALALVAAACTGEGDDPPATTAATGRPTATPTPVEPGTTPTPADAVDPTDAADPTAAGTSTPSAASTPSTTPPTTDAAVLAAEGQRCTSPGGFTVSYPQTWEAVADCGMFGPAPVDEPEAGTDERAGVVSAYVEDVPFGEVAAPAPQVQDRAVTVVEGLQAVRLVRVEDGAGLYPAGTTQVQWLVDLSPGVDAGAGTLFLTAVDAGREDVFPAAVETLDAMARTLVLDASPADAEQVIARYEGGGTPFTVAAVGSASDPATCARLLDVEGTPACLDPAGETPALTALGAPGGDITIGLVDPSTRRVDVVTGDEQLSVLPVPVVGRDLRAFALPFPPSAVQDISTHGRVGVAGAG